MLSSSYWIYVVVIVLLVLGALYACLRAESRADQLREERYFQNIVEAQAKEIALSYPPIDWDEMLRQLEWQQLETAVEEARGDFPA